MTEREITLTVNGVEYSLTVPVRTTLADALRERLDVTSPHLGCEHGVCGACTVLIDGLAARSCITLAVQVDGSQIDTLEGAAGNPELTRIGAALVDNHAMQCGFCTPALVMTLAELFADGGQPTRDQALDAAAGCLCRCTGYVNIVKAVEALVDERANDGARATEVDG